MDKRKHRDCSTPHGSESNSGSQKKQRCSSSGQGWISHCFPSHLIQTTKNFTPEQCDLIRMNGFGGLLNLKCWKNPPQLLYHWLAKHFNCATSELVFSNGTIIPVTAKSVQLILGIPYGNRKVKYRMDSDSTAFMKHDYYSDGLPARISSIAKQLSEMKKADDHFLRTFLLFAVSSFLCPTTCLRISPRCFPSLVDLSSVAQLDWCGFVLEQLVSSIKRYKQRLTIGGCMFFLAVHYLDHLDTGSYRVPDSIPRTVVWTTKVIEKVVNMDTISEADGIYGNLPVKATVNNTCINSGLKIPPIIGEGLTVEQFVSSHVAADCDPTVKGELCRVVNNFCTNATSLLSIFVGSFLRDFSGLIPSSSNTIPHARQKPSCASSQAKHSGSEDESSDKYHTEDETFVEDMSVSDDASEDESDEENSSSESYSDDVSSHDDASEESDDPHASLDGSGNELAHKKDGDDICKQEVPGEVFSEVPVPPGYPDIPSLKQEPGSPARDKNLHQHTANEKPVVPSGSVQQESCGAF
uniref:Aminotransferase-like plant mobile domain-containing protein n=1 Tax=Arundo donax TaxID=35708 RepID=A0A0A8YRN1_ARUDO